MLGATDQPPTEATIRAVKQAGDAARSGDNRKQSAVPSAALEWSRLDLSTADYY